jgi:hypothetical protein
MATWKTNPVMEWSTDGGTTWYQITDHGREPLTVTVERIENVQRMADGTLRRYVVAKKRTFQCNWTNIPSVTGTHLANGQPGSYIENIHDTVNGPFYIRLRAGADRDTTFTGLSGTIYQVMITDFSKDIVKRSTAYDMWNLDITLEEC